MFISHPYRLLYIYLTNCIMSESKEELISNVKALQEEVKGLQRQFAKIQDSSAQVEKEDITSQLSDHQYFDDLINDVMIDGSKEISQEDESSTNKNQNKSDVQRFKVIKDQYAKEIMMENCYRLGGITGFPVYSPENEWLRGIRFDIFDSYNRKFVKPHYIILKRKIKSDDLFVYKSTIPDYIPVNALAYKYLNISYRIFAQEVRKQLVLYQLRKSTFDEIADQFKGKITFNPDISYTKIQVNMGYFEIIFVCGLSSIESVIIICDQNANDGSITPLIKRKLELAFRGCELSKFVSKFPDILEKCNIQLS